MSEALASRRRALHGMVATGCGMMLMTAFPGCDSKKPATTSGPPPETPQPAPASAPTAATPAAPSVAKAAQTSVQYQLQPKGEQKCANCAHFIAASKTCKLVEGSIGVDAWCVLWAKAT